MKNILHLIFFIISISSFSQNWSEPIQISTLQGLNNNPDFFVANNGDIHCVWSYRIEQDHRIIYYSKSVDEGVIWSSPEDISQNTTMWMENPHIVADSQNKLHLTYDYNCISPGATLILYRFFNGVTWSDADTVSPGYYGSRQNRLVIDNDDVLYCFWVLATTMCRKLEDGIWSDISIPYNDLDMVFFEKGVVGPDNTIYCTGVHHYEGQSTYDSRIISFNFMNNDWQPWVQLSDNTSWGGNDIALSSDKQPAIIWRQYISDSIPPNHGAFFSFYNGTSWSAPELIVEKANDQAIVIDICDRIHIVTNEDYLNSKGLVHYQKINNEWLGEIIEEDSHGSYSNKIVSRNQYLYMINLKVSSSIPDYNSSIVFRKYDVITTINRNQINNLKYFELYPNPLENELNIKYNIDQPGLVEVKIFDLHGSLISTLMNKVQSSGNYNIQWDAMNGSRNKVKPGIYLVQIKTGKYVMAKRAIIVN
jgi:hypothetical protein